MLQSHTVLLELFKEKLVTEDEVKRMKENRGYLPFSVNVVSVQYTKPPEVVTRTADLLVKFRHNSEARKLKGW